MEKVKEYMELKEKLNGLGPEVNAIESEISQLNEEYEPLEEQWLKYQILDDPRAEGIKKEREKILKKKTALKEEFETGKKKLKIMASLLNEKRMSARDEINAKYLKIFEGKFREFVKVLKKAEAMEKELFDMRKEGQKAMTDIDASQGALTIPAWPVVLIPGLENSQVPAVKSFTKFITSNSKIKL